ncbi:MAG TPA: phosphate ABC transporter permease PstA [Thermoanaerobaculia bacterium]|jgi:phosphate transport system permease protein
MTLPTGKRARGESGTVAIWLTGGALAACLLMIVGVVALVVTRASGFFWPSALVEYTLKDGKKFLVEELAREEIPPTPENPQPGERVQVRLANRDLYGLDFRWVPLSEVVSRSTPPNALLVQRQEYGDFQGYLKGITREGLPVAGEPFAALLPLHEEARRRRGEISRLEKGEIGEVNYEIERKRLAIRKLELKDPARGTETQRRIAAIGAEIVELEAQYHALREKSTALVEENEKVQITLADANGEEKTMPAGAIVRYYRPNGLTFFQKVGIYFSRLWEFVAGEPRESNTEGGVFPAIFGTVMMVILMSAAVMPLGVLAALYLREYAKQGPLVRGVRIAVNNLAGVPSIVFGVFGLGFFVYLTGGAIDRLFYSERLPDPTFKTGGILWAALTLALLTVPVVIVATEESLAAVPRGAREGSYALGGTKWQTIRRVVLPAAAPGILTGLILAMARGAGEVAPLMITGVVKLAPELPFDGNFPFFHLERKFMHLGFHIYDVGFQSPNVEAAKPMVYITTLLLLGVVITLNLAAILIRERLRRKLRSATF